MYIPEFWCGVIATVMVEFIISIITFFFAGKNEDGSE